MFISYHQVCLSVKNTAVEVRVKKMHCCMRLIQNHRYYQDVTILTTNTHTYTHILCHVSQRTSHHRVCVCVWLSISAAPSGTAQYLNALDVVVSHGEFSHQCEILLQRNRTSHVKIYFNTQTAILREGEWCGRLVDLEEPYTRDHRPPRVQQKINEIRYQG